MGGTHFSHVTNFKPGFAVKSYILKCFNVPRVLIQKNEFMYFHHAALVQFSPGGERVKAAGEL